VPPVINQHRMTTRAKLGHHMPTLYHTVPLSLIPKSYRAALADPNWGAAMEEKVAALSQNKTWDLIPRPPGTNVISSKWVFKIKYNPDGSFQRYKDRWAVRGYSQRHGVDFGETFSPVVKPATVRTVLSLVVSRRWSVHQLDVKNAFLHGMLTKTVYYAQPSGFEDSVHPYFICRLNKSLYGLKQASRAWNNTFAAYVLSLGFVESKADTSLFVLRRGAETAYLLLYVDDIILTASSPALLRHIIQDLQ
jgi:histone deacetylase 1/2